MVSPNTEMFRADLVSLVSDANNAATAGKLAHGPFVLFNPPSTVTDLGAWAAGTYNAGDQVTCDGYLFVSVINLNASRPLDATTGNANTDWQQPWQSCYQRIRNEVQTASGMAVAGVTPLTPWNLSISGPWPCQAPDINYDKLAYYFEDTGSTENVTISGTVSGVAEGTPSLADTELLLDILGAHGYGFAIPTNSTTSGTIETDEATTGPLGQFRFRYVKDVEFTIVIGGANPVGINVSFVVVVGFLAGVTTRQEANMAGTGVTFPPDVYDTADPTGLIVVDTTNWIPGATFTPSAFSGWAYPSGSPGVGAAEGNLAMTCTLNATVNPGTYKVKFSCSSTPNNRASGTRVTDISVPSYSGFVEWACDTFAWFDSAMEVSGTMSLVNSTATTVPGIDDTKVIKKIAVTDFSGLGPPVILVGLDYLNYAIAGGASGVLSYVGTPDVLELSETDPVTAFSFAFRKLINICPFVSIGGSTPGYWFGATPPVTSLGMIPFNKMPWNTFPNDLPATGANTAQPNRYLNYILPFKGGKAFTNTDSLRAYNAIADAPAWVTTGNDAGELLPWPKRWKSLTHYPAGFTILDSYGNLQTLITQGRSGTTEPTWPGSLGDTTTEAGYVDLASHAQPGAQWKVSKVLRAPPTIQRNKPYAVGAMAIDDNGNRQKCTTAGTTDASTIPTWATMVGATTADGTVTWTLAKVNPKFNPAVARISPPIYPFFWHNPVSQWEATKKYAAGETITDGNGDIQSSSGGISGATEPAWLTTTSDGTITWRRVKLNQPVLTDPNIDTHVALPDPAHTPFAFRPQGYNGSQGWWIYRVFLNRIPQKKSTVKPDATPISVQLGCVRGGVFVSFGTFSTGTPVDAMWPIFTSTALAYEAAERVDVQAEIITCGQGYGTWGNVHFPMAAAHINDIETVIGLL